MEGKKGNDDKAFTCYPLPILSPFCTFSFNTFCFTFPLFPTHFSLQDETFMVREWRHRCWDSTKDLLGQLLHPLLVDFDLILDVLWLGYSIFLNITWPFFHVPFSSVVFDRHSDSRSKSEALVYHAGTNLTPVSVCRMYYFYSLELFYIDIYPLVFPNWCFICMRDLMVTLVFELGI